MNSADKEVVMHCLKSMIDEAVCEECPLYGMTGTDHCEKDCVRLAINALEQEDEYIKVPKKALKYRTAGMVAYNVEWLKKHFNTERLVICGVQEPCEVEATKLQQAYNKGFEDCRQAAIDALDCINGVEEVLKSLPPVTPAEKVNDWIPVSERYPEDGQRVLVDYCDEDAGIMLIRFNVNGYHGFKAWMPLPERFESNAK